VRIALLSRWNATCGVSMHAEMITREFLNMGLDVKVFAPYIESADKWWHHKVIREDEDFVIRCYNELNPNSMEGGGVEEENILSEDFDALLVESYTSIPYEDVERLVTNLRNQGIASYVIIHEGSRDEIKYSTLDVFNKVIVFDERYMEMLRGCSGRYIVIPYPCHPVVEGNRGFMEDDTLRFFSFGRQPEREYIDFIDALNELRKKYELTYRIVRSNGLLSFNENWIIQEQYRIGDTMEVYSYLHASDIHLLPKGDTNKVVVSSTLCQCIGSLTPIVAPDTRHFETLPDDKPILLYRNKDDLLEKLELIIEDEEVRRTLKENSKRYVEMNRVDRVAGNILDLLREETKEIEIV